MTTTKGYTATRMFMRKGRWVSVGDPVNLTDREALYLFLAGKVERDERRTPNVEHRTSNNEQDHQKDEQKAKKTEQAKSKRRKRKKETPSVAPVEETEAPAELEEASALSPEGAEE